MRTKNIAFISLFSLALFLSCSMPGAIGDHIWKCVYSYDKVIGCSKDGFDMTQQFMDTETVTAPDATSACLLTGELALMLNRVHVICHPEACASLGPAPVAQDFDAGVTLLSADAGADAGPTPDPIVTCPNDCHALITQGGAGQGQLYNCLLCAAGNSSDPTDPGYGCCQAYVHAVQLDPGEASEVLACWEASSTSEPGQQQCTPPAPAGAAASFNACMLLACQGPDRCGNPNFGTGGGGL